MQFVQLISSYYICTYIYTTIYDPEEQALIHLQTTEDYTTTGEQYLTKYNLAALCKATTGEHITGMQVKAPNHTTPWTYNPKIPRNNLHDRFTKVKQSLNLNQTTNTSTAITKKTPTYIKRSMTLHEKMRPSKAVSTT